MRINEVQPRVETLYVYRPVLNHSDIFQWAQGQGFEKTLKPVDFHTTVAYSRAPIDWSLLPVDTTPIRVKGGIRTVKKLGDKAAVVLSYQSNLLLDRWTQIRSLGASWDWDDYTPHITITYLGADFSLDTVVPYPGPIVLGPEKWSKLNTNWEPSHVWTAPKNQAVVSG